MGQKWVKTHGMATIRNSYHVPLKPLYNKESIHGMVVCSYYAIPPYCHL